jgi:hypothetical protein
MHAPWQVGVERVENAQLAHRLERTARALLLPGANRAVPPQAAAPHRTASHSTAPHRTAQHRMHTAPGATDAEEAALPLGHPSAHAATSQYGTFLRSQGGYFHGTGRQALLSICEHGFDDARWAGGKFGRAQYGAGAEPEHLPSRTLR